MNKNNVAYDQNFLSTIVYLEERFANFFLMKEQYNTLSLHQQNAFI